MKRSPIRVIELCAYVLIIILAVVWLAGGGKLYNPPGMTAPPVESSQPHETAPPLYILPPKSEYQKGQ